LGLQQDNPLGLSSPPRGWHTGRDLRQTRRACPLRDDGDQHVRTGTEACPYGEQVDDRDSLPLSNLPHRLTLRSGVAVYRRAKFATEGVKRD